MKPTASLFKFAPILATLAFAEHAPAATVAFTSAAFGNVTQLSTTGTLVDAAHFGNASASSLAFNGITFAAAASSTSILSVQAGTASFITTYCNPATHAITGMTSADQDAMFDGLVFGAGANSSTVTLNNLVIGQTYQMQLLMVDDRTINRVITVDNIPTGGSTGALDFSNNQVQLVTGSFTADAATQTFKMAITGNSGASNAELNAYQLRDITPVPEPSAALLGGLGLLALLRRRRNG